MTETADAEKMKVKTHTPKDFLWTKWNAGDIKRLIPLFIAHKKARYAEIKKIPAGKRTFENTVYAIESSDYDFIDRLHFVGALMNVSPDESMRKAAKEAVKILDKKMVDIEYDEGLYCAVREYAKISKKEKLLPEDKKLLTDMLRGYRRMGFDLPKNKREELKRLIKKLNRLSTDFSNNINEYKDRILVSREELAGLPEGYIDGLKRGKNGKYIVTLEYPDLIPFLQNARNAEKRKELSEKNLRKGGIKNMKLLAEILKLRHKKARLLGYKNHIEYKTEDRMAKNEKTVFAFVRGLMGKIEKSARNDLRELEKLKREMENDQRAKIAFYDVNYYSEQLKKKKFNLTSEKVREYFPFEKVLKGTFEIYSKLFSVKFEKLKNYPTWHRDVEVFAVRDKTGQTISYLMFDLYPRENKYGHACVEMLVSGRYESFGKKSRYVAPMGLMITNFPKPRPGYASLLNHGEVETFFHEFGHLMHVALSKAPYASQSGYNVKWDFAEAPSQMLEHWVWDKKMLKLLSKHYETGKPLPEEMAVKMIKAKNHMEHYANTRQLMLSLFDLTLHKGKPPKNPAKLYNKLTFKHLGLRLPEKAIFPAGFGHLMGYDSGYYGYMWSKVYAVDMFTRFAKEGLLNPKTGADYREWILEKGSSEEEMDLVRKFLGRAPNNMAFLREIGVK